MHTGDALAGSLWHRLSPWPLHEDAGLRRVAACLGGPDVRAALEACDRERAYPAAIRARLDTLGLSAFFAETPGDSSESRVTIPHLAALNQLAGATNTSLAITVGINAFALLPVYLSAGREQREWAFERVRAGAYAAMLLSEADGGSDLLANRTRAEPGALDAKGSFVAGAPATHYRLSGRKDLINGGGRHELLMVLARTREAAAGARGPLSGHGDFSLLLVERDASVGSPRRWHTACTPAADIASTEFRGTLVPAAQRVGREGGGFALVQKTLAITRGGVGAIAAGLATRAAAQAASYAETRRLYGAAISGLGAIADHLLRIRALELLVTAMSVKAAAALNFAGSGAVYYGALAKYACGALTEELVAEGCALHGARSLLAEHPYHQLRADGALLSIFDGTTHVVLEQLQWRLAQLALLETASARGQSDTVRAIYATRPRSVVRELEHSAAPLLLGPITLLRELAALPGTLPLEPLIDVGEAVLALGRACREEPGLDGDQGTRLEAAGLLAQLETLIALAELADAPRRRALGLRSDPEPAVASPLVHFAGRLTAALRTLMARTGTAPHPGLESAERAFGRVFTQARGALRQDPTSLSG
jgi:alkylation response protein AidB-like acyl-CoA dehydrogenase